MKHDTRTGPPLTLPPLALLFVALLGCQALLDDHPKVDVDFCGGYGGEDECCAEDDPCDLGDDQQCDCDGCEWDQADCTMAWTFTDQCDDGQTIHVGLYEVGGNGVFNEGELEWESLELEELGEPYTIEIRCNEGEKVCYGAWSDDGYWLWGCAENCSEYCEACCWFCDYNQDVPMNLHC